MVQSLSPERHGEVGCVGGGLAQAHHPEHEDDSGGNEDAFDDSRGDVAECENLALSPCDRVEDDGRSDVGDDEKKLQQHGHVDQIVVPAASEVTSRVVENF
jgi:hypothetical protein